MIAAFALAAAISSAPMYLIGANSDGALLVSADTVKRSGDRVEFVAVSVFSDPAVSDDGTKVATHVATYHEANCRTHAMRGIKVMAFNERSERIEEWIGDGWQTALPGNVSYDSIAFACSPTIDTKRFRPVRNVRNIIAETQRTYRGPRQ